MLIGANGAHLISANALFVYWGVTGRYTRQVVFCLRRSTTRSVKHTAKGLSTMAFGNLVKRPPAVHHQP